MEHQMLQDPQTPSSVQRSFQNFGVQSVPRNKCYSPNKLVKCLFGSDSDVSFHVGEQPCGTSDSRLSMEETNRFSPCIIHTPEILQHSGGLFSPAVDATWSASCTDISGIVPRNVRRKMSTEGMDDFECSVENTSGLDMDFQISKTPSSPEKKTDFAGRKTLFQSKRSEPSFLKQKDFTPILLQKTGKKPSWLNFDAHYRFLEVIGRGNFGEVWKAEHHSTKKLYAIKKSTRRFRSSKERDGHLREITSVAKLDPHDHLVRYFRAWQVTGPRGPVDDGWFMLPVTTTGKTAEPGRAVNVFDRNGLCSSQPTGKCPSSPQRNGRIAHAGLPARTGDKFRGASSPVAAAAAAAE